MWPFEQDEPRHDELQTWEDAVQELRHLPDGPSNEREWADLGRQLNRLGALRGPVDPEASVDAFREAAQIWDEIGRPKAAIVSRMRLAVALARVHKHEEAVDLIESLIDLSLANPDYRLYADSLALHRAAIFCAAGELGKACDDLDRVIDVRSQRKPGSEDSIVAWRNELQSRSPDST